MCMHSRRHVLFGKPNPAQQQPLNQDQSFIQWSCDPPRNWSSLQETHPSQNQKQNHETYQISPLKNSFEPFRKKRLTHVAHGTKMRTGSSSYAMIILFHSQNEQHLNVLFKWCLWIVDVARNILSPQQHFVNHCTQDFARNCCSSTSSPSFQGRNQHRNSGLLYLLQWKESKFVSLD